MAKYCDICGEKLGLRKFRCQDGRICKKCYGIVSNHYSNTIIDKTLAELKELYDINSAPIELGEGGFVTNRKVGTFLLIDDTNKKICIPGNPTVNGQYSRPEIYSFEQLDGYRIKANPDISPEELVELKNETKEFKVIQKLMVQLKIKEIGIRNIIIIPSPVRSSTYAFRQSYKMAMNVIKELNDISGGM